MKLITWNIQWCRGVDQRVDPQRIVVSARDIADFDVLCLQEVAAAFPDPRLAGSHGEDQFETIAQLLSGFTAIDGTAIDMLADDGPGRRRFGNMILSRHPVRRACRHPLPMPVEPGVKGMRRIAVEAQIAAPGGDVRVITTHLEYYSAKQRSAQIEALRGIYAEGSGHARLGSVLDRSGGPFTTIATPAATVITGDFNLEPADPLHARMLAPFADGTPALVDAWQVVHPGVAHPPTFRVYEKEFAGQPESHCDFIFVSPDLAPRIRRVEVDATTQSSDHQPVLIEFA